MPAVDMTGQWIGWSQTGDNPKSFFMTNSEARSPHEALVTGIEYPSRLRSLSFGSIQTDGVQFTGKTWNYLVFDTATDSFVALSDFYRQRGVKQAAPIEAHYRAHFDGQKIAGQFRSNTDQNGTFELWRTFSESIAGAKAANPKTLGPMSWNEFKKHISQYHPRDGLMFRGQPSNAFPLKTSFHRRGRNNLYRYLKDDVGCLRRRINSICSHYYQPAGEDLLGLLSLAQHHGFPTPLLDWSESPYVAAFFAFECLSDIRAWLTCKDRAPVRIFIFDRKRWERLDRPTASSLRDPCPDFQFTQAPAHNNPRYYPQQSVAAFSTVEDIEGFVAAHEKKDDQTFITRVDIDSSERDQVEADLRFMGLTAATLFPGLEGACKSLAAELF